MAFHTTHDSEDLENFYYTDYPPPVRTMEASAEIPIYCIPSFADISCARSTYCCIGKKGNGVLVNPCKTVLSNNTRPTIGKVPITVLKPDNAWSEAETLVKLARSCLCEDCCTTQLSDVVVAWINEIEDPVERGRRKTDSVVGPEDISVMSRVVDISPVRTLVAASVATREVFSTVFGFWSGSGRTLYY